MLLALTRDVSPAITRCELTHRKREPIDLDLARGQHAAYEAGLRDAGCRVERLAAGPDMPDSVFIEDTAVVFDEVAIITRPGAASRRTETAEVADVLGRYRPLHRMEAPATADGGDVLLVGRQLFVGRTSRTNSAGIDAIRRIVTPYAYNVTPVEVRGSLHLKSAVTAVGDNLLLMNPEWLPAEAFAAFERIEVHRDEPAAANALRIGNQVIYASMFPRTLERLQSRGLRIRSLEATEIAKAEGAMTCCSLIFECEDLRI
jgi:dimethylargininase